MSSESEAPLVTSGKLGLDGLSERLPKHDEGLGAEYPVRRQQSRSGVEDSLVSRRQQMSCAEKRSTT